MAYCGADLMPLRCVSTPTHGVITLASSAPVTTATTPGAFFAAAVSMLLMRACACGERTKATCAMRGSIDVADILAAPLRQPRQIGPRHRAADIGIRPVERGEAGRLVVGDFHVFRLPLQGGGRRSREPEAEWAMMITSPSKTTPLAGFAAGTSP